MIQPFFLAVSVFSILMDKGDLGYSNNDNPLTHSDYKLVG